jgi:hypothetical protein
MTRIAILDPVLPAQVRERPEDLAGIDVGWAGSALDELRRVLPALAPAVLVVSLDSLGADPLRALGELEATAGVELVIVLYRFASREVLRSIEREGRRLVKAPVSNGNLRTQMLSVLVRDIFSSAPSPSPSPSKDPPTDPARARTSQRGSTPPRPPASPSAPERRYSDTQLGRLAETRTSVVCECPNHIATMLQSLVAFEQYARDCENRNERDAEVHRMLGLETARARRILEDAMQVLLVHEKIVV